MAFFEFYDFLILCIMSRPSVHGFIYYKDVTDRIDILGWQSASLDAISKKIFQFFISSISAFILSFFLEPLVNLRLSSPSRIRQVGPWKNLRWDDVSTNFLQGSELIRPSAESSVCDMKLGPVFESFQRKNDLRRGNPASHWCLWGPKLYRSAVVVCAL